MNLTELGKDELIDIIHRQADDIAALQLEIGWLQNATTQQALPKKEALQQQPVEVDGELWYFRVPRWQRNGKTITAEEAMMNEPLLRSILANPYQVILKKANP